MLKRIEREHQEGRSRFYVALTAFILGIVLLMAISSIGTALFIRHSIRDDTVERICHSIQENDEIFISFLEGQLVRAKARIKEEADPEFTIEEIEEAYLPLINDLEEQGVDCETP